MLCDVTEAEGGERGLDRQPVPACNDLWGLHAHPEDSEPLNPIASAGNASSLSSGQPVLHTRMSLAGRRRQQPGRALQGYTSGELQPPAAEHELDCSTSLLSAGSEAHPCLRQGPSGIHRSRIRWARREGPGSRPWPAPARPTPLNRCCAVQEVGSQKHFHGGKDERCAGEGLSTHAPTSRPRCFAAEVGFRAPARAEASGLLEDCPSLRAPLVKLAAVARRNNIKAGGADPESVVDKSFNSAAVVAWSQKGGAVSPKNRIFKELTAVLAELIVMHPMFSRWIIKVT